MEPFAVFGCPTCVEDYRFDLEKIRPLKLGARMYVKCPACGNTILVYLHCYSIIRTGDPSHFAFCEIVDIQPPIPGFQVTCDLALNAAIAHKHYQKFAVELATRNMREAGQGK